MLLSCILTAAKIVFFSADSFPSVSLQTNLYLALIFILSPSCRLPLSLSPTVWFLLALGILFPLNIYLTLAPAHWWTWLWEWLQMKPHPSLWFSVAIVELALFNFLISHLLEVYTVDFHMEKSVFKEKAFVKFVG